MDGRRELQGGGTTAWRGQRGNGMRIVTKNTTAYGDRSGERERLSPASARMSKDMETVMPLETSSQQARSLKGQTSSNLPSQTEQGHTRGDMAY